MSGKITSACAAAALALCAAAASAQDAFPVKPIQVVLPLQAGSASDIAVRLVAEKLTEILGQGLAVENVSGAGGRSAPTGSPPRAPTATPSRR